ARPGEVFPGHVESVAAIASQQDWASADVKVYGVQVVLDGEVEGLWPGMSATVTIETGDPRRRVLAVPVEAITGSAAMGGRRRCYVQTPGGPEARDVVVGSSDGQLAEIREGLCDGEEVVLNPAALAGTDTEVAAAGHD